MNRLAAATLSLLVSLTPLLAGNQLNNNRNTSTAHKTFSKSTENRFFLETGLQENSRRAFNVSF